MAQKVLVVEDDEILRALTVEAISLLGVQVIDCESANSALLLLEYSSSIVLVMTDICMPGSMDGLALALAQDRPDRHPHLWRQIHN